MYAIDFLSNGFKIRGSNGQIDSDSSYIYAAWAEAPSFNLYGGQSNGSLNQSTNRPQDLSDPSGGSYSMWVVQRPYRSI